MRWVVDRAQGRLLDKYSSVSLYGLQRALKVDVQLVTQFYSAGIRSWIALRKKTFSNFSCNLGFGSELSLFSTAKS